MSTKRGLICTRCGAARLPGKSLCAACRVELKRENNARQNARGAASNRLATQRPMPPKKMLPCLACDAMWLTDAGHRICPACSLGDRRGQVRGRAHGAARDSLRSMALTTSHHPASGAAWPTGGGGV